MVGGAVAPGAHLRQEARRAARRDPSPTLGETVSNSDLLEKPDVRDSDTGNANEVFHYVRKNKIAESAVMGTLVEALCGEVFPVTKSPKPGSPVCPACKEVYEQLRKE
ncbi:hypothetical protein GCM10027451_47110 [Geodermatophilus aquaeductus]|uniref:DUF3039 domain-containing protein n=1 Tax=Geodermatophilus aquaeductus TaxID=1564161 RepID=A0A521FTA1_9ACTN|nr:Protein of unknown function [Geodermatophilus aquaeductus]